MFKPPCDEGVVLSAVCERAEARRANGWVLATAILGSGMVFIDGTVVNLALPILQTEFGATLVDAQWVIEAYTLFLAALMLVGGSLGDRFGRRRVFALGVILFAGASAWCGAAPNVQQLILARAAQGIGGALLTPASLALISASFPPESRGKAIGTWSGFSAIVAGLGPLAGGWLIDHASWRWIFWINVPLALIALTILYTRISESRNDNAPRRLDWPGALAAVVGLGAIVYGLVEWTNPLANSTTLLASIAFGIVVLCVFVVIEARSRAPMMPLSLFRSRTFTAANLITLLLYFALSGALFFVPFDLIQIQGYTTTAAGAALLPFILIMFVLSRWSGGLVARYGPRPPLIVGPLVAALGFALFALPGIGGSYWATFFPAVVVLGLGMAISVPPLTTAVMTAVSENHAGLASGINNAVSRIAGLLAIAVLGVLLLKVFSADLDRRLNTIDIPAAVRQKIEQQKVALAAIAVPESLSTEHRAVVQSAIRQSFLAGFRAVMLIAAALAAASAVVAWNMMGRRGAPVRNMLTGTESQ